VFAAHHDRRRLADTFLNRVRPDRARDDAVIIEVQQA